jgi:hypothetical protein
MSDLSGPYCDVCGEGAQFCACLIEDEMGDIDWHRTEEEQGRIRPLVQAELAKDTPAPSRSDTIAGRWLAEADIKLRTRAAYRRVMEWMEKSD